MESRDQPARERWNERFASAGLAPRQDAPSEWLLENEGLLRELRGDDKLRALDVAAGNGRNALYLAALGFEVDAVDISDVAVDQLRAAAHERDLPVRAQLLDLESASLPDGPYDVVVNMNYLQRDLFGELAALLRPGGLLLVENFAPAHIEQLGQRVNPDYVLGDNELLRAFPSLHVRRYSEGVVDRSGRPRGVASLVAQRPAAS
jgi:tellurite methyltransferase